MFWNEFKDGFLEMLPNAQLIGQLAGVGMYLGVLFTFIAICAYIEYRMRK